MEKDLLSIILPTYNVEHYLDKCLSSVTQQTYRNIEIIIVIDGATDESYNIALRWKEQDKRIRVYWQDNAGSGAARNTGLTYANGEFVMFVDPDDWIDSDMIEAMMRYRESCNADLVISKSRTVDPNGNIISQKKETGKVVLQNQKDARNNYFKLLSLGYLGAPTRKIYRMSIIKEQKIEFPDLRRSQDVVFNYRYFDKVHRVVAVDDIYYNYMVEYTSYTSKLKADYYRTLAFIFNEICSYCKSWDVRMEGEDYSSACSYLFRSVVANLEANYLRKEDFSQIYEDVTIKKIIEGSIPKRIDEVFLKKYCMSGNKIGIQVILKMRILYKKGIQLIRKKFR